MTAREEKLAALGWQKKSTTGEPRLSELMQAYRRIGCEVHLEPFDSSGQPGCRECMHPKAEDLQTIYIRKPGSESTDDHGEDPPGNN